MNPHTSPWNQPRQQIIQDQQLRWRWQAIKKHLLQPGSVTEHTGTLTIDVGGGVFYIAKHASKFRLRSHLDWAWYTPKTLAQAMDNNSIDQYYEIMLGDVRSDPNEWKDQDFEQELKAFYAARAGRCSLI